MTQDSQKLSGHSRVGESDQCKSVHYPFQRNHEDYIRYRQISHLKRTNYFILNRVKPNILYDENKERKILLDILKLNLNNWTKFSSLIFLSIEILTSFIINSYSTEFKTYLTDYWPLNNDFHPLTNSFYNFLNHHYIII